MNTSPDHYRTSVSRRPGGLCALALGALLAAAASPPASWPAFLPDPASYAPPVVAAVRSAFGTPTLTRTVEAEPAPVPYRTYLAFVDAADLTAAAARHLGLAHYEVQRLGPDVYAADDHAGSRGVYQVLVREGDRRVILSWGSHSSWIVGTLTGHALSVLEFEPRDGGTGQRITAWVRIDNAAVAAVARALAPLFGGLMDRRLTEGFRVTSRVAEWAQRDRGEFCAWLEHEPSLAGRRGDLEAALATCGGPPGQAAVSRTR